MANVKTIVQDVLNTILVFAVVGMGLSARLQPLVDEKTYSWIMLVLAGLLLVVYNADMIFGFSNSNVPTPPTTPVI